MDCLHPVEITVYENDQLYNVPRPRKIFVPCGKCEVCLCDSSAEWRTRLQIERAYASSAYFCTLTYEDTELLFDSLPDYLGQQHVVPVFSKRHVQLFFKRLRRNLEKSGYDTKISYFVASEYGATTFRPHYHAVIFNLPCPYKDGIKNHCKVEELLRKSWTYGNVMVDPVTDGRISYVTKYIFCNTSLPEYYPKPFRLMSRNPSLGSSYMSQTNLIDWHRCNLETYIPFNGFKYRMPRYLRNKIFDDDMKAQLQEKAIEKMRDKEDKIYLAAKRNGLDYVDFKHQKIDNYVRKFKKDRDKRKDL